MSEKKKTIRLVDVSQRQTDASADAGAGETPRRRQRPAEMSGLVADDLPRTNKSWSRRTSPQRSAYSGQGQGQGKTTPRTGEDFRTNRPRSTAAPDRKPENGEARPRPARSWSNGSGTGQETRNAASPRTDRRADEQRGRRNEQGGQEERGRRPVRTAGSDSRQATPPRERTTSDFRTRSGPEDARRMPRTSHQGENTTDTTRRAPAPRNHDGRDGQGWRRDRNTGGTEQRERTTSDFRTRSGPEDARRMPRTNRQNENTTDTTRRAPAPRNHDGRDGQGWRRDRNTGGTEQRERTTSDFRTRSGPEETRRMPRTERTERTGQRTTGRRDENATDATRRAPAPRNHDGRDGQGWRRDRNTGGTEQREWTAKQHERPERPERSERAERPYRTGSDWNGQPARPPRQSMPRKPAPTQAAGPFDPAEEVRISKLLSEQGLCSRREADEYIERGWVFVNGERVTVLGERARRDAEITLAPQAKVRQAKRVTILLNKPVGYVSGQPEPGSGYPPAVTLVKADNQQRGDADPVFMPHHLRELAPAGRLDIDSTGLLVLTQDGRVARNLIGEDSTIDKEYLVRVKPVGEKIIDGGLALLNHGLSLDGEALKPAYVEWINDDQLRFVLREGKKRQIRRMCELVGLSVTALKRIRIGSVRLSDLPAGQWRFLRDDESF